ncbi:MAG TPA: pyridoxamine 5'-phosphate oxidase family protein [Holophagaceae bacterium]|nr:pyridoxamine 5'-phosphate oxidase family protein [Holophagaceae bacterium]
MRDPFHEGELAAQAKAGEADNAILNSRMIADAIMLPALPFMTKQPWAILGGPDAAGQLWCSALVGEPGFVSPDAQGTLVGFDLGRAPFHPANPLFKGLQAGRPLGGLFIELATRRRLRVNGTVTALSPEALVLAVRESFPNCPKFIQKRAFEGLQGESTDAGPRQGTSLGDAEATWIQGADTLFLTTIHPERGADTSHRGGAPGFVTVVDAATLRLPDYPGNSLFQSFGNLEVDPRMGLLIPDFRTGHLLHLSGTARVDWKVDDPEGRTGGTGRFLTFHLERWALTPPAVGSPRWTFLEASPLNP